MSTKEDWPRPYNGQTYRNNYEEIYRKKEAFTPKTRAYLSLFVQSGGTMIELGVAKGRFAVELIEANPSARYIGIDRWSDHHDGEEYAAAKALIEMMGGQVIRSTFADAVGGFPDAAADLIYIDGYAHTGQLGGATLREWWPKLKPGGIFAGHDYCAEYQPTIDAVDAFVAEHGIDLHIIDEKPHPSWWLIKPK